MKHLVAYVLILIGIVLLGDAAYDEQRGIAEAASPDPTGASAMAHLGNVVKRNEDPEGFRNLMFYQWLRAPLFLFAGLVTLGICRRADRLDPFSADFAGNRALDELTRTLAEEQAKQHRPLK